MDELPTDYDIIVIGTGMTGSIVAAACSRVGKSILHLDENDYYGEEWASFNLETLSIWLDSLKENFSEAVSHELAETDHFVAIQRKKQAHNVFQRWYCSTTKLIEKNETKITNQLDNGDETGETLSGNILDAQQEKSCVENTNELKWTKERLMQEYRKFSLDLSPRMLFSRGSLVELLISSNIARYTEFKTISRVLTWRDGRLEVVPCSRADVFATKHVSVVQKRMLVKILTSFADYPTNCCEEFAEFENKSFVEYLKHKKVDDQLIHYIVYAIAMGCVSTPCLEGIDNCKKFLQSLGRYGNTPFIFPLYGSGEIPQCFCRLCAVFGGVYHLKRSVSGFVLNNDGLTTSVIAGKRLNTKAVVVTSSICPDQFLVAERKSVIYRAIFITSKSIVESDKENVTLLQFPPQNSEDSSITVMEVGPSCQVCPQGLFLVHMTTELELNRASETDDLEELRVSADELFKPVTDALFRFEDNPSDTRPEVLWSLVWERPTTIFSTSPMCPPNFKILPGPDATIDYELAVAKAQEIFKEIYPDEEFLPRAPDPDEIIQDYPETQSNDQPDLEVKAEDEKAVVEVPQTEQVIIEESEL